MAAETIERKYRVSAGREIVQVYLMKQVLNRVYRHKRSAGYYNEFPETKRTKNKSGLVLDRAIC